MGLRVDRRRSWFSEMLDSIAFPKEANELAPRPSQRRFVGVSDLIAALHKSQHTLQIQRNPIGIGYGSYRAA